MAWSGWRVEEIVTIKRNDLETALKEIEELRKRYGIAKSNVLVDSDGLGAGVQDFGHYQGFINNAKPIFTGTSQHKDNFNNLKSQCYFYLCDMIRDSKVFIKKYGMDQQTKLDITAELEQLKRFKSEVDGKVMITPKVEMIENLGRSPDYADALMMRSLFELKKFSFGGYLI